MLSGDALTERIIGLAIEVHRCSGPGLLESAYEQCLCFELAQAGIPHLRQAPLTAIYKTMRSRDGLSRRYPGCGRGHR